MGVFSITDDMQVKFAAVVSYQAEPYTIKYFKGVVLDYIYMSGKTFMISWLYEFQGHPNEIKAIRPALTHFVLSLSFQTS